MTRPDDDGFARLTRRLSERGLIVAEAFKDKCLRRRVAVRMRACGVHTYHDYLALLDRRPGEYDRLVDALTINVTKFFRNRETWERLAADLLPELYQRRGREPVRVWSAGCASGEEPYTLAMLFARVAERLGHPRGLERVTIDATDIDRASLERAAAAVYPETAFGEAPPEVWRRYCEPAEPAAEGYRVTERLRARVRFHRLDLNRDPPPAPCYDLVVCRNVIIYFDRATQERLFERFAAVLSPGGLLLLGKVETLVGPARERFGVVDTRERIFRRSP